MSELRFYVDENVDVEVVRQLQGRGIDATHVRDLDALGDTDRNHLIRATEMSRVLVTHDTDFIVLAASGIEHAGIVWSSHHGSTIGGWVRTLPHLYATESLESARNRLFYVNTK